MPSSMASYFSSACHLLLFAFVFLAIASPRVDAWGGRLFFSKMTRPEPDKADTDTTLLQESPFDPNSAPAFPRPSSVRSRGYGLYGRPEENSPPSYFRRGAGKRTTTITDQEAALAVEEARTDEPSSTFSFPENGSGRGRPLSYDARGQRRENYGMSDTRLYQNGRFYYDVETDRYGYGDDESSPVQTTRPVDYGSGVAGRRGRYGGNADRYEYGRDNEFGNGPVVEKQNSFEENQNEQGVP